MKIIMTVFACVVILALSIAAKYAESNPTQGTRIFKLCRDTVVVTEVYGTNQKASQIKLCRDTLVVLP